MGENIYIPNEQIPVLNFNEIYEMKTEDKTYKGVFREIENASNCWVAIDGSNLVFNMNTHTETGRKRNKKPGLISSNKSPRGYLRARIQYDEGSKLITIHRLVASACWKKEDEKKCVNHIDGIKTNNHPINLEWCTTVENIKHAHFTGLVKYSKGSGPKGSLNGHSILNEKDVETIKILLKYTTYTTVFISNFFGVKPNVIHSINIGRSWKHIETPVIVNDEDLINTILERISLKVIPIHCKTKQKKTHCDNSEPRC